MAQRKFSDRWLASLKPPANGQAYYYDTLTPAFGVCVGKGGRKSFQVLTRVEGRGSPFHPETGIPDLEPSLTRAGRH